MRRRGELAPHFSRGRRHDRAWAPPATAGTVPEPRPMRRGSVGELRLHDDPNEEARRLRHTKPSPHGMNEGPRRTSTDIVWADCNVATSTRPKRREMPWAAAGGEAIIAPR